MAPPFEWAGEVGEGRWWQRRRGQRDGRQPLVARAQQQQASTQQHCFSSAAARSNPLCALPDPCLARACHDNTHSLGTSDTQFFTEWEESFDSFDQMGLHENLLRGIYAYGEQPACARCRGGKTLATDQGRWRGRGGQGEGANRDGCCCAHTHSSSCAAALQQCIAAAHSTASRS